ncbi:hypothetical protein THAOC_22235, partial [Thalassiosira oceanica]
MLSPAPAPHRTRSACTRAPRTAWLAAIAIALPPVAITLFRALGGDPYPQAGL